LFVGSSQQSSLGGLISPGTTDDQAISVSLKFYTPLYQFGTYFDYFTNLNPL